jgi:dCMP deaminase
MKPVKRISWHEYFMTLAKITSLRSSCNNRKIGAVIVQNRRVVATGYVGSGPGAPHCSDQGPNFCLRRHKGIGDIDKYNFCPSIHAEANALAQAARLGISVSGADLYCTLAPCYTCLKQASSSGICKIYYEIPYTSNNAERDQHWMEAAVRELQIVEYAQIKISEETMAQVIAIMQPNSSRRRMKPTN